MFPMTSLRKLV